MFNNTNTGFNFGQTPSTTASTIFSSPTSSFGNVFGTTANQQGNKTSMFGTQPAQSSGFNFNFTSPTTQSSSGFGTTNFAITTQPATTGFLFDTPQTTITTQSGFSFGTTQPAQATQPSATASSIFGSSSTAPQQPSLFGQTTSTSSFSLPSTGSLFGLTPSTTTATSFTGFGLNPTTTAQLSTSTFAAQQPSIFGSPAATSVAPKPTFTSGFGLTSQSSLTSTTTATTNSGFNFNFNVAKTSASILPAFSPAGLSQTAPIQFGSNVSSSVTTAADSSSFSFAVPSAPSTTASISSSTSIPSFNFNLMPSTLTTTTATTSVSVPSISSTTVISTTESAKPSFGFSTTSSLPAITSSVSTSTSSSISTTSILSLPTTAAATTSDNTLRNALKPSSGFIITPLNGSTTSSIPTTSSIVSTTSATSIQPASQTSQLTFGQLEDQINIWMNELSQFEADFHSQSQTINSWDSLLISNGQKLIEMNLIIEKLKITHKNLDHQLDFIVAQQKELEQLLEQIEENKFDSVANTVNSEREHTYSLVETVHNDLNAIGSDLKDFIRKLNENKSNQDMNDPMIQILKILNSHMDVLQWMENQIKNIKIN
ncbi:Nuclear pore glycoprotein p62 [Sarcoptes scabiei]|uniref:Nuclear pore glycoprotein p62 n=2 Tax=Sarcoptes scabiei TaxID=52283 RepID=A0A834VG84_SARSC|nr:Nuclear pore glycoprotein p62 [Sarcoptes scabiei]